MSPLEQLKCMLSEYGDVTHTRSGQTFRLALRFWEPFPLSNLTLVDKITTYFHDLGIKVTTASTKNNLYVEWEIRK
jgi:hypothetical protein